MTLAKSPTMAPTLSSTMAPYHSETDQNNEDNDAITETMTTLRQSQE